MHSTDSLVRLSIAAVIFLLYFFHVIVGGMAFVLLMAAVLLTLTAFVKFCLLNHTFKIKTQ